MKRIVVLLLTGVMTVALLGCGGGDTKSKPGPAPAGGTATGGQSTGPQLPGKAGEAPGK